MAKSSKSVQDWFTKRLQEFYTQRYRAYLELDEAEDAEGPETVYARDNELSTSAVRVPRADSDKLPDEVRAAYDYYWKHFEQEDIGFARVYKVSAGKKKTYTVRVRTDGDDGYL